MTFGGRWRRHGGMRIKISPTQQAPHLDEPGVEPPLKPHLKLDTGPFYRLHCRRSRGNVSEMASHRTSADRPPFPAIRSSR